MDNVLGNDKNFHGAGDNAALVARSAGMLLCRLLIKGFSKARKNKYDTKTTNGPPHRQRRKNFSKLDI